MFSFDSDHLGCNYGYYSRRSRRFCAGIGVAGMVLAGEIKNMGRGGLYSMGMEMYCGFRNMPILSDRVNYQIGNMSVNLLEVLIFLLPAKLCLEI